MFKDVWATTANLHLHLRQRYRASKITCPSYPTLPYWHWIRTSPLSPSQSAVKSHRQPVFYYLSSLWVYLFEPHGIPDTFYTVFILSICIGQYTPVCTPVRVWMCCVSVADHSTDSLRVRSVHTCTADQLEYVDRAARDVALCTYRGWLTPPLTGRSQRWQTLVPEASPHLF